MTDLNKSLEVLEQDVWDEPTFGSYVVKTCHAARKKPLGALSDEEIRCLIAQKVGLRYLLPIAVARVEREPLAEVTYFPGDLLLVLLRLEIGDWAQNFAELRRFSALIRDKRGEIDACGDIPGGLAERYAAIIEV